jgi:hypothetical protein
MDDLTTKAPPVTARSLASCAALAVAMAVATAGAGCSSSSGNGNHDGSTGSGGAGGHDGGGPGDGGFPSAPVLGAQIDRMGRPAINTALNHAFDADMTAKNAAKDQYNAALPPTWPTLVAEIAKNLAILDGLDMNCHNQLLHAAAHDGADRYAALATALADDQLYLDTSTGTCAQYLAVELVATGVAPTLADCGGRTPLYDVIDSSYSALAAGTLTGVSDGIAADDAAASTTVFPFLVAP